MKHWQTALSLILVLLAGAPGLAAPLPATRTSGPSGPSGVSGVSGAAPARPRAAPLARLPLAFEPNAGQADPEARFLARTPRGTLFFTHDALVLAARPQAGQPTPLVRLQFLDANPAARLEPAAPLPGRVSYFTGRDPARWQRGLPRYATLHYRELYPGIDLTYGDAAGTLKGTYTVAPGADPARIRWRYTGVTALDLDAAGNLQIQLISPPSAGVVDDTAPGAQPVLTERAPVAWQERDGQRVPVSVRYAPQPDGTVGFALGPYDPRAPLVVDPDLVYASYFGGLGGDTVWAMTVDAGGTIYLTGDTSSPDFPLYNPVQPVSGGWVDAFVSVLDPSGTTLLFSTYLGGFGEDVGEGIGVDAQGNVYVGGITGSPDFPIVNALQPIYGGGYDAFVAQIDPTGARLVYSTYLGGGDLDGANAVSVDAAGRAYLTGATSSLDFPLANAFQPLYHDGGRDAFVTRIAVGGTALEYSTYLGGSGWDFATGLAVDATGSAYVTGRTHSTDYPLADPVQPNYGGGGDAFVTTLTPPGSALAYSTYLGGSRSDWPLALAVDPLRQAYVTGFTESKDFPQVHSLQGPAGRYDVFVTKLNAPGTAFAYSTYLGGQANDRAFGLGVDRAGRAWVTGQTESSDFPTVDPIQAELRGADIFISQLAPDQPVEPLVFSTYLGGGAGVGGDLGRSVALDGQGNVYVAGETTSSDFPLAGQPFQREFGGRWDGVVVKLLVPEPVLTPTPAPGATATATPPAPATATPSATPVVRRLYVPLVLYGAPD
jgi:hypothetical protein